MADQKISQLTEKQTLGANDLFVVASSSNNYKVKGETLKDYVQDGLATVASTGSYTDLINKPTIPTKTSDLTNDSNFITASDIPALPSNTDLSDYDNTTSKFVDETDLSAKQDVINADNKLSYNYLSDTPTIPDELTDLTDIAIDTSTLAGGQLLKYDDVSQKWINGSGSTASVTWSDISGKPNFATVATSGDYDDLTDKPTIPTKVSELNNDSGFITGVAWGDITGSISNQTDLSNALSAKIEAQAVVADTTSTSATIASVASNTRYTFSQALTSLTLTAVVNSVLESEIEFTTSATFAFTATPLVNKWLGITAPSFLANTTYIIAIKSGYAVLGKVGA